MSGFYNKTTRQYTGRGDVRGTKVVTPSVGTGRDVPCTQNEPSLFVFVQ